jgi:hypothetical protein
VTQDTALVTAGGVSRYPRNQVSQSGSEGGREGASVVCALHAVVPPGWMQAFACQGGALQHQLPSVLGFLDGLHGL